MCEGDASFVGVENSPLTPSGGLASLDALGKSALEQSLSASTSSVQWTSRQQHAYVTSAVFTVSVSLSCILLPSNSHCDVYIILTDLKVESQ